MAELHWGDLLTIVLYFILCLGVGLWSSCRTNTGSIKGYFLAGRNMMWLPVGASVFATNVGSHFFVGMAGSAAANGIGVVVYEWHAVFILLLLGWFFIPVYVSSGAYTMPEYLKKRFGGKRLRIYLSCLAIVLLILQKISVSMYAGAVFIEQSVGWDMYSSIISVTLITAVYTIVGGLSAVIWTDTLQTVIMLIGSIYLTITVLFTMLQTLTNEYRSNKPKVGGYNGLREKYIASKPNITTCGNTTAGYPREDSFNLFRDPVSGDIPWPGAIFGLTPMAILAWCTDQVMVQRVLAAKTHSHAKGGLVLASYLKILPMFLIVFPGMISRVLFPDEVGCVDPAECMRICGDANGCSNIAYPLLVVRILPPGVRGLMLAVMLSALMSTLTSVFNSSSSMFTIDLWARFRTSASQRELMIVSRLFIVVLVGISIAWIPILTEIQGGQLWNYLQSVQSYLAPPWSIVFILGIAWQRTTEQGAFWGLMAGLVTGVSRMVIDFSYPKPACGEPETRPAILYKIHFLYFAAIISFVTFVVCVVVSLLTTPRPKEKLYRVTWATRNSTEPRIESDDEEDLDEKYTKLSTGRKSAIINEKEEYNKDMQYTQDKTNESGITCLQRTYNIICCYSSFKPRPKTPQMEEDEARRYKGEREPSWIKHFINVNAILVLAWTVFLFGFFH